MAVKFLNFVMKDKIKNSQKENKIKE